MAISAAVDLARRSLTHYLQTGQYMASPSELPPEFTGQAGTFVSLKKGGALRGCIGTFSPTQSTVAEEIIHNAVSAGTGDPRFSPVELEEMDEIGFEDYVYGDGLTMIEWANLIEEILPEQYHRITIEKDL